MKKVFVLVLILILVASLFAGCKKETSTGGADDEIKFDVNWGTARVGMITDTGGLGDESFNDSAYAGLERARRESNGKVSIAVLESEKADDYPVNLNALISDGMDLAIAVGFLMEDAVTRAAQNNPNAKFAIIDAVVGLPNVASATFDEHEGAFLVGVIAGMRTQSNVVGFVGGIKFALIEKFEYGFRAGVKAVNPNAVVLVDYAESFVDSDKGKEIALIQNSQGADVIFHASGGTGIGVIAAAEERGFWAIGVDQDQSDMAPGNVLCSMIKRVDTATFLMTAAVSEGKFEAKVYSFGLAEDGVGFSDKAGNTTQEERDAANKFRRAIIDGKFVVPQTQAEFEAFTPPNI